MPSVRRLAILAAAVLVPVLACGKKEGGTRAHAPSPDDPVTCKVDSDCPILACGPCTPGETVTQRYAMTECHHNPCMGHKAVCRDGVCVVGGP